MAENKKTTKSVEPVKTEAPAQGMERPSMGRVAFTIEDVNGIINILNDLEIKGSQSVKLGGVINVLQTRGTVLPSEEPTD